MMRPDSPKVLVIEDDPDTSELITATVNGHFGCPCTITCASVEEVRRVDFEHIDLALCDYHLPDGTGIKAMQIILDHREDVPVILVTGEREIVTAVEAIRHGAADYLIKFNDYLRTIPIVIEKNLEVARIRRDNLRLQAALSNSLAELKRKNRELEEAAARFELLASTDLLTNLANRRVLEQRLAVMFSEALRYGTELTCLMIDLDGFKATNDTLGHQRGDDLLVMTGRIITDQVRTSDVGARYGGDEFVIALPQTTCDTAVALGQRLIGEFRRQSEALLGDGARCGMSIGIASLTLSRPLDPHQLIAHADNALYRAKMSGRSRIMVCGPDGKSAMTPESLEV